MSCVRVVSAFLAVAVLFAGCAKPPQRVADPATTKQSLPAITKSEATKVSAYSSGVPMVDGRIKTASISNAVISSKTNSRGIAGRSLTIGAQSDIKLAKGEVVITFDDGPRPGKTDKILSILAKHDAKATFLMLGQAAQRHPGLVREVAKHGHTIGLHTHSHGDLTKVNIASALAEIERGQRPIEAALSPINKAPAPFFRFPYLAQTSKLRTAVNNAGLVIMDVQIDSKDYYKDGSKAVLNRTLARLDAQGKGIILFHDIHQRTVDMLPEFLVALKERGYKVVSLVPERRLQLRGTTLLARND